MSGILLELHKVCTFKTLKKYKTVSSLICNDLVHSSSALLSNIYFPIIFLLTFYGQWEFLF